MQPALQQPRPLTYDEAYKLLGGLSEPSKMPWWGWSTPAQACITGSKLRSAPNSVCSSCYALKGRYMFGRVKNALARRLEAVDHPQFVEAFVTVLSRLYQNTRMTYVRDGKTVKENRFRWHDSGDIQSMEHLRRINEIALALPEIDFWLPTREIAMVRKFGKFAPNLTVRVSFPLIGGKLTNAPYLQSTVGRDDDKELHQCPAAAKQGNKCLNCRACWDHTNVNYPLH